MKMTLYKDNNNSNQIKCLLFLKLVFILYTIVTNCDKCYIRKDLQIPWSLQRKQNKNKIILTKSLKGNKVEKNYTRLWIVNYSRNNIK